MDQPTIFDWTAPVGTNGFGSGESALLGLPAEVMSAIFGNNSCEKILELRLVSGFKPIIDANIREIYNQMRRQDPYLPAIWPAGTPRAKSDHENYRLFQNECKFADKLVSIGGDKGLDWRLEEAWHPGFAHFKNGPAQAVYHAQKLLRSDNLWDRKAGHRDAYETHARRYWGRADDKKKSLNVFLFYVKNGVTPLTAYYFATAVETWVQPWFPQTGLSKLEEAQKSIFGTRKSRHAPLSYVRAIDTASEKLRRPSVTQRRRDRPIINAVALFANEFPVERLPEALPDDTKEELDVYRPDYTAGALIKEADKIVARMFNPPVLGGTDTAQQAAQRRQEDFLFF